MRILFIFSHCISKCQIHVAPIYVNKTLIYLVNKRHVKIVSYFFFKIIMTYYYQLIEIILELINFMIEKSILTFKIY